jgi:CBS domain-containing protein
MWFKALTIHQAVKEHSMRTISEVMTRDFSTITPDASVQDAAQMMRDLNIGALPVAENKRLLGMITDRDIAIRAVAEGESPEVCLVSQIMSSDVAWCYEDQSVGDALQLMGDRQIRRLPVVHRNMELAGVVSLGDLALRDDASTDTVLEEISAPIPPPRAEQGGQPTRH